MSKTVKDITNQMIIMWGMTYTDWLGFFKDDDMFSYHHLRIAKRKGGPVTIDNGAILCKSTGHPYLHIIECHDRDKFLYLTKILIEINDQRYMPTFDQLVKMDAVFTEFEREHSADINSNGGYLIRDSFERRLVRKKDFYFLE